MRDQQQRYDDGWNEVGGTQLTRSEPDGVALIESVEEIGGAPQVEHPDQGHPPPAPQAGQREQGEHRGDEITVGGRARERDRQLRRDHAGHQECQADKAEAVQTRSGRSASTRGWLRRYGQRYRAATIPHARKPHAKLIPNRACGGTFDVPRAQRSCVRRFMASSQTSPRSSSNTSLASCGVVNQKPW